MRELSQWGFAMGIAACGCWLFTAGLLPTVVAMEEYGGQGTKVLLGFGLVTVAALPPMIKAVGRAARADETRRRSCPFFAHFAPFFAHFLRLGARKPDSAKERRKNGGKRGRNGRERVVRAGRSALPTALIGHLHLRRVGIADRAAVAQAAVDRRDADGNIGGLAAAQRDGQLRPLGEGQPAGECQDAACRQ